MARGCLNEKHDEIRIELDKLITEAGISKNKLRHREEMQRSQINHYCNNEISRPDILDTDAPAESCTVLECEIGDLLAFIHLEKQ